MKTLKITIGEAGGITIDAQGFQGKACEKATSELLQAIGADTTKTTKKPEYYQTTTTTTKATR